MPLKFRMTMWKDDAFVTLRLQEDCHRSSQIIRYPFHPGHQLCISPHPHQKWVHHLRHITVPTSEKERSERKEDPGDEYVLVMDAVRSLNEMFRQKELDILRTSSEFGYYIAKTVQGQLRYRST